MSACKPNSARTPSNRPRALPEWFNEPDFDEVEAATERHADFNDVILFLSSRGRLSPSVSQVIHFLSSREGLSQPFPREGDLLHYARSCAVSSACMAVLAATKYVERSAIRGRAMKLARRIDRAIRENDKLVADLDAASESDLSQLLMNYEWRYHVQEATNEVVATVLPNRLDRAKALIAETRAALVALHKPLELPAMHDGRRSIAVAAFVNEMAYLWGRLTGKPPGRTGGGNFAEFCAAAWVMLGWPTGRNFEGRLSDRLNNVAIYRP
jgi:hypothetical protein